MKILYETTFGDLVAYERYRYDHSPSSRPQGFIMNEGPILVASLHAVAVCSMGGAGRYGEGIVALPILFILWRAIFRSIRRWCYKKGIWQIYREAKRHGLMGPREMELEGDNLIEVSDYHIRTTPLDVVEKIVTTDEYGFFYTGAEAAFVIPRRYLSGHDFQSFITLVARACEARSSKLFSRDAESSERSA